MRVPSNLYFQEKVSLISEHYMKLSRLQQQQSSEKKLLAPSDDPVLASRIQLTKDFLRDLDSYKQNEVIGLSRAKLFESSIMDATGAVSKIRELLLSASSDTMGDSDRKIIAEQLNGFLKNLLNTANAKDGNGDYIYSGYNTSAQPYVQQGDEFVYQGTINSTLVNIGPSVSTVYNQSGFTVFGDIPTGNGRFTIEANASNTGSASTTPGSVVNSASYIDDTYTMTFVTNSAGHLAYQIVGASSGQVIPALPATIPADAPDYVPDRDITFNGLSFHINGQPNVGDSFEVAPSKNENIFNTVQELIQILKTPINNDQVARAQFHQKIAQSAASFTQAFEHILDFQSQVGTQVQLINKQIDTNNTFRLEQTGLIKALEEVDIPEVMSKIMQETFYLQATAQSYKQIEQTLLELIRSL